MAKKKDARKDNNKKIGDVFEEMAYLYEINSVPYKPAAYRKAARALESLKQSVIDIYQQEGEKGLRKIAGIGQSTASKIAEYLTKGKIATHEELKEKTALREIVTHFFETKNVSLQQLKMSAKRQKIIYGRHAVAAKQLLDLAGSVEKAKEAITKVADWANSRGLDYAIETTFKKWLELDRLKPKEVVKKPFYRGMPMVWSEAKKKWFVVQDDGEWLEFADDEGAMEWKIVP